MVKCAETAVQTFDATKSECQFGAEVTLLQPFQQRLSFFDKDEKYAFTWKISEFSSQEYVVHSDVISFAERKWRIAVAPRGYYGKGQGNYLSIHLLLCDRLRVNEKLYVKASIRVISTNASNNIERHFSQWYSRDRPPHGFNRFMSLEDLYNSTKGFIVGDSITIETQFQLVSKFD